jgi:hypothetical protein
VRSQNSKVFEASIPLIAAVILLRNANGFAETVGSILVAIATTAFVHLAARFVWAPILSKAGFWWSPVFLGCALSAVVFAGGVAGVRLGAHGGIWNLLLDASTAGLFLSWALAAILGVTDGKGPEPVPAQTPIRSRLLRGRRRTQP